MDKDLIWKQSLGFLLKDVPQDDPRWAYLPLLSALGIAGNQFILTAPLPYVETWVKKSYLEEISEAINKFSPVHYDVSILLNELPTSTSTPTEAINPTPVPTIPISQPDSSFEETPDEPDFLNTYVSAPSYSSGHDSVSHLAPKKKEELPPIKNNLPQGCTFDTFVEGPSNSWARSAALSVAERPGCEHNPLFMYGASGLGKTHLMISIANYVINTQNLRVTYAPASQFTDDYIAACRHDFEYFNLKYRSADVLLIDDVQFWEGKIESTNTFFDLFNELIANNKQIVLSADRAPKDIDMDERITSRFSQGFLADIQPPNYETRLLILKRYLERTSSDFNFFGTISDDVLAYIATNATSNIREIEGAIRTIMGRMTFSNRMDITEDEARTILQNSFSTNAAKSVKIAAVQSEVERYYKVSHEDLIGSRRDRGITTPRHIAFYLCRYLTEDSLNSIGRKFGKRDHTTIMHGIRKIEESINTDRQLFDQIETLKQRILDKS